MTGGMSVKLEGCGACHKEGGKSEEQRDSSVTENADPVDTINTIDATLDRCTHQTALGVVTAQFIPSVGWTALNLSERARYATNAAAGMRANSKQAGCHARNPRLSECEIAVGRRSTARKYAHGGRTRGHTAPRAQDGQRGRYAYVCCERGHCRPGEAEQGGLR